MALSMLSTRLPRTVPRPHSQSFEYSYYSESSRVRLTPLSGTWPGLLLSFVFFMRESLTGAIF